MDVSAVVVEFGGSEEMAELTEGWEA